MNSFLDYARYYDLLYQDKDYDAESEYVHSLLQRFAPGATSILELGCGTGLHAVRLADKGYTVHGIDISRDMLSIATDRIKNAPQTTHKRLSFDTGDIRVYRSMTRYDAVISLFHVISYQTSNHDLQAAFETTKLHLRKKGVFIFDCWYGPAVLTDRPKKRIKQLENDELCIKRTAVPTMHSNDNIVDVHYDISITSKHSGNTDNFEELHRVRYLFMPEIRLMLAASGFELIHAEEWMSGNPPGFETWSVCFVGQA